MKQYIYLGLVFLIVAFFSCGKEEFASSATKEFIFLNSSSPELFFAKPGTGEEVSAGVRAILHSDDSSSVVNYTYEVLPSSTAEEGVHFVVNSNSGTIPAGEVFDILDLAVIPDSLIACVPLTLDIQLVSSDLSNTDMGVLSLSLNVEESGAELAGTVNYVHTDNFAGVDLNGTVEITALATPGSYTLSDFSFGSWKAAYNIDAPGGNLKWTSNCNKIELSGTDNYGDSWQMDEILESGGPVFTFKWSNTYGEFGTVSLTRQDGKSWPDLSL